MKFKCLIIPVVMCSLCHNFCFSQNSEIDSLKNVLLNAKEDVKKIEIINELSFGYYKNDCFDSSLHYAKYALMLAEKINYTKGKGFALVNISICLLHQYYTNWDSDKLNECIKYCNTAFEIALQTKNKILIGRTYSCFGEIASFQHNYNKALENYNKALDFYSKVGEKSLIILALWDITLFYKEQNNYTVALKYTYKTLKYSEETGDEKKIADCYYLLGGISKRNVNYIDALKFYYKSLAIYKSLNKHFDAAWVSNAIADVYLEENKNSEALTNYFFAEKIFQNPGGSKEGLPWSYNGIGRVYDLKGDSAKRAGNSQSAISNFNVARNYYQKSLEMYLTAGDSTWIADSYIYLCKVNIKLFNFKEAKRWLDNALALSKKISDIYLLKSCYLLLSEFYSITGNYRLALDNYKTSVFYLDSINSSEEIRESERIKLQYQFNKVEDSLKQNQLITETKLQAQKNESIFIGLALYCLGCFLFLCF
ncbi:MAG: tetratricopeptide repeat protein [Chitinophagaceae bacterium]|nr:tetratricopeptide repeat protein [Chitinophagaceae bacterium]